MTNWGMNMNQVDEQIFRLIKEHQLLKEGDRVLIGISGGPDSMLLLYWLWKHQRVWSLDIRAAHLNHQFRGAEADEDQRVVEDLCYKLRIPCYAQKRNVSLYQEQRQLSKQSAARECRYQFFEELVSAHHIDKVAVAHHADDQVETVLMRMIRGAGVQGMGGMPVKRSLSTSELIRPLMTVCKQQIEAYCQEHELKPRTDTSNTSDAYTRNVIRQRIIPHMTKLNPNVQQVIYDTTQLLQEENQYLDELAQKYVQQVTDEKSEHELIVDVLSFRKIALPLQRRVILLLLSYLTENRNWGKGHIDSILGIAKEAGRFKQLALPDGIMASYEYDKLIFSLQKHAEKCAQLSAYDDILPCEGTYIHPQFKIVLEWIEPQEISVQHVTRKEVDPKGYQSFFDAEQLTFPLKIRYRRDGDWMQLFGAGGSKKIKKIFIDHKISRSERSNWPVIADQEEIIWLPGLQRSNKARITGQTTKILKIQVEKRGGICMEADIQEVLISEAELKVKVKEIGVALAQEYKGKNPLVICILKGAAPFMTDLIQHMNIELEMDFMDVSSYGQAAQSSGEVKIIKDLNTTVAGRDIIVVEDIIDSGLTLNYIIDLMKYRQAGSVKIVTLLDKPEQRTVSLKADITGFTVPNEFVVGYGLDFAEKYRNLPYIGVLKRHIYEKE